jgi:MFS transporter
MRAMAISAYGGGHIVTSMLGEHLADRFGRLNKIALWMFAPGAAMLALSQARGYFPTLACMFFAGSAAELYRPASSALIGDLVAPEQRVLAFGLYRLAINLGFAGGPATAGYLADRSLLYIFVVCRRRAHLVCIRRDRARRAAARRANHRTRGASRRRISSRACRSPLRLFPVRDDVPHLGRFPGDLNPADSRKNPPFTVWNDLENRYHGFSTFVTCSRSGAVRQMPMQTYGSSGCGL